MLAFVKRIIQKNKKEYFLLTLMISMIAAFEYFSLVLYSWGQSQVSSYQFLSGLIILPTIAVFTAFALSIFIAKYFIENKKQEFAILLLSGAKNKELFIYLLYQYIPIVILSFLLGSICGEGLIALTNLILQQTSINIVLHHINGSMIMLYILFMILTIICVMIVGAHQFTALDLKLIDYLTHKKSLSKPTYKIRASTVHERKKIPIFSIIFVLFMIYIFIQSTIFMFDFNQQDMLAIAFYYLFLLLASMTFIHKLIPLLYDLTHHLLIKHPVLLQGISSFMDFSQDMLSLVNLNACLIPTLLIIVILYIQIDVYNQSQIISVLLIPIFMMILIMICLCFILRYTFYNHKMYQYTATYYAIGYSKKTLSPILWIKNILFVLLALIIPLVLFIGLLYRIYLGNILSLKICYWLVLFYITIYIGVFIYILLKEKKMLKEVTHHVKYLDRS